MENLYKACLSRVNSIEALSQQETAKDKDCYIRFLLQS
jgi:hypothetical protein